MSPVPPVAAESPRLVENGKGLLFMGAGMFLFSAVDTTAKFLTGSLHPFQIVWTRQLGLLVVAVVLVAMQGRRILVTGHPKMQLLRGTVASFSAALFTVVLVIDALKALRPPSGDDSRDNA